MGLSSLCLPSSGGSGGTGGGLAFGCLGCVCCSCLATTGGSLEKMSCSMEKNSNKVEVYGPRISTALTNGHVFAKVLLRMCCHIWRSFGETNFTHIISPVRQIRMVDSTLRAHILPWPDCHILRRRYEANWRGAWVFLGNPNRDWEGIGSTSKCDRQDALHVEQE